MTKAQTPFSPLIVWASLGANDIVAIRKSGFIENQKMEVIPRLTNVWGCAESSIQLKNIFVEFFLKFLE